MRRFAKPTLQMISAEHQFFYSCAVMCLVVALVGFGRGFVDSVKTDIPAVPFQEHFHDLLITGWLLFFLYQTKLIKRHSVRLHKRLGAFSVVLFSAVIVSGVVVSLANLVNPVPPPINTLPNNLFALQLVAIVLGPLLYVMALLATRYNIAAHKRFMLILAILMEEAAVARMHFLPGMNMLVQGVVMAQVYHAILLVPLVLFDLRQLKRLHPATTVGLLLIIGGKAFTLWSKYKETARGGVAVNIIEC